MNSVVSYLESSFLKDLLKNDNVTDISFNGETLFYQDNINGRHKLEYKLNDKEAFDFVRQIANLSDSMFSYSDPILDISCGRYRINATHYAISRKNRNKVINFSIRIGQDELRILDDKNFINEKCVYLIQKFIEVKESIIISGITGSGKTELQKFIISKLEDNSRVLVIDNVEELEIDCFKDRLDIQTWVLRKNINLSFDDLIKNALRINPDWLILSEARGEEMLSLLNGAMTGHPTISTIHSKCIKLDYQRMTRMCLIKNNNLKFNETLRDLEESFRLLIHLHKGKNEQGNITRFVEEIGTNIKGKYYWLYKYPNKYNILPIELRGILNLSEQDFKNIKEIFKND